MLIIAHRGSHADLPENTLAAFEKAIELGADMIEMDVRRCGSGELVLHHDAELQDGRKVSVVSLRDLTGVNTLEEVLMNLAGRVKLDIELKAKGLAEEVLKLVKSSMSSPRRRESRHHQPNDITYQESHPMLNLSDTEQNQWNLDSRLRGNDKILSNILISSFHWSELEKLRALSPDIQLAPVIGFEKWSTVLSLPRVVHFAKSINAYSIHISRQLAFSWFIRQAHRADLKIFVYTVNDLNEAKRLKKKGVDGLITDDVNIKKIL